MATQITPSQVEQEVLNPKEVATMLGLNIVATRTLIQKEFSLAPEKRRFPNTFKFGKLWKVPKSDVLAYMAKHSIPAKPAKTRRK